MNIDVLRAREAELNEQLRAIHVEAGEAALNDDQTARWDSSFADLEKVRSEIAEHDKREADAKRIAEQRARWGSLQVGATVADDESNLDVTRMGRGDAQSRALKRLEKREGVAGLSSRAMDRLDGMLRTSNRHFDGDQVARSLLITETPAYRSAFSKAMSQTAPAYTPEESAAINAMRSLPMYDPAEFRAASEGTTTAGGFGIPVLIDPTIILTDQEDLDPMRRISGQVSITTNVWKGVSSAGVSWSFDAEAAEVSDDAPTLAQPSVTVHAARGFIPYSIEVGQDYPGFQSEFGRLLSEGYADLTSAAFITGTGSAQPFGILTALDANTNVEVVVTTDGTFSATDVDKVWTALPDRWKRNATWLMSSDVDSYIALWGDAYGGRTVDLTGNVTTLRGRPTALATNMPSFTGSTGAANILVVGDFKRGYLIVDRVGMMVEPIPHLFGTTNGLPTGQRGIFAMARVGADSIVDTAFRLLQNQ